MRKYSRKREAILEAISHSKAHPTAESIYAALKPEYPDLSLGTVYRNISVFKDAGEVICVGVVGGHERLDGNTSPHPHFICDKCGKVEDVENVGDDASLNAAVENQLGCRVETRSLVFHGVCGNCL